MDLTIGRYDSSIFSSLRETYHLECRGPAHHTAYDREKSQSKTYLNNQLLLPKIIMIPKEVSRQYGGTKLACVRMTLPRKQRLERLQPVFRQRQLNSPLTARQAIAQPAHFAFLRRFARSRLGS